MKSVLAAALAIAALGAHNTGNSLPEKMTTIAQLLAVQHDHAKSRYQITYITDAAEARPVDIARRRPRRREARAVVPFRP